MLRLLSLLAALLTNLPCSYGGSPEPEALGCQDEGIFPDLDGQVRLELPPGLRRDALSLVIDELHALVVLYDADWPIKAYPLGGPTPLTLAGGQTLAMRPGDAKELRPWQDRPARVLKNGERPAPGDRDGDGLPDPLDVLIGAKKLLLNAADYTEGYVSIPFPGGDVPRDIGVCTDVLVRAIRNAGLDLQAELYKDIGRAPRSYPMVKKRNPSIDHRRVKTILPYFRRNWQARGTDPHDREDPFRPGDVIFFDTFPSRPGPDHVGIVSDTLGPNGLPMIVNNWTTGAHDSEMDLLSFVPVTDRFRLPR